MGGKSKAPPPDPRMGEAALRQIGLAESQWQNYLDVEQPWLRDITDRSVAAYERNLADSGELSRYQLDSMRRNDERYWGVAVPFENQLLEDVNRFDSAGYKQGLIDQSLADVGSAFDRAGDQNLRGLQRRSVNPSSGAALALTNQNAISKAMAEANAANKTRQAAEQVGLSTKMQMWGGMRGLAGLGATNAGLATGALGLNNATAGGMVGAGSAYIGAGNGAFGSAMGGMSQGIQGMGNYTQLQQNAAKINNDADPFASILGAGAKLGAAWIGSDRRLKRNIVAVGVDAPTGLTLYEFNYRGRPGRYRGVMADEVATRYPHAVITMGHGFQAVDYGALGIDFVELEGEAA